MLEESDKACHKVLFTVDSGMDNYTCEQIDVTLCATNEKLCSRDTNYKCSQSTFTSILRHVDNKIWHGSRSFSHVSLSLIQI